MSEEYRVMNDINFSGQVLQNLGEDSNRFTGKIDGQGYTFSNMVKTVNIGNQAPSVGLINWTGAGAEILNLKIGVNWTVSGNDTILVYNCYYIGGLIGVARDTLTVKNVQVSGSINGGTVGSFGGSNFSHVGGIVGVCTPGGDITLENCINNASVTGNNNSNTFQCECGGIVGTCDVNSLTIRRCVNNGAITLGTSGIAGGGRAVRAGGIIGASGNSTIPPRIIDCYNSGDVSVSKNGALTGAAYLVAGGLVGAQRSSTVIANCYSTGKVIRNANTSNGAVNRIGGITGESDVATNLAINTYYLASQLFVGTAVQADANTGSGTIVIDGTSVPPRGSTQGSGAKAQNVMQVTLANAQANNTIYYTGNVTSTTPGITGWDFTNVWNVSGTNYPILR